ncbi:hypothetical protein [Falsiroseomonas oryziterrae]|uniref:hypothetical protein n=1 Tax=Falsiroseomonas oryziterrae TaxID=2911368 RepID=UPI001F2D6C91|nr:hypothetical protein [Roseomonas sp. NPKOSM-4]
MAQPFDPAGAARWLAEAFETGNPLAALPEEIAPRDLGAAEEVAAATLAVLELVPCGIRLLRRGGTTLSAPMVEGRLIGAGRPVATAALRHAEVTAAAIGVLAEPLDPDGDTPPVFARLHPALDIAATRFTAPPEDSVTLTADLARLGLVVAGKAKAMAPATLRVALGAKGVRVRGAELDLAAAFAEAAVAARRWGGLPAGALLVVAGLTPPRPPEGVLRASLGALGSVEASFA